MYVVTQAQAARRHSPPQSQRYGLVLRDTHRTHYHRLKLQQHLTTWVTSRGNFHMSKIWQLPSRSKVNVKCQSLLGSLQHTFTASDINVLSASVWTDRHTTTEKPVGDPAFPVAASRVWNDLPQHVTAAESLPVFCSRLKTHLFRRCFPWHQFTVVVPEKWLCHSGHVNRFCYLLTYDAMQLARHNKHCLCNSCLSTCIYATASSYNDRNFWPSAEQHPSDILLQYRPMSPKWS